MKERAVIDVNKNYELARSPSRTERALVGDRETTESYELILRDSPKNADRRRERPCRVTGCSVEAVRFLGLLFRHHGADRPDTPPGCMFS